MLFSVEELIQFILVYHFCLQCLQLVAADWIISGPINVCFDRAPSVASLMRHIHVIQPF